MRFIKVWSVRVLVAYLLLLVALFIFYTASTKFQKVAQIEKTINRSTFVFWQGGELYRNPPLFSAIMEDADNQLSMHEPTEFEDVDIWVLLLNGFSDIRNVDIASALGLDPIKFEKTEPGSTVSLKSVSLRARFHILPFYVQRRTILMLDANLLKTTHKSQCFDKLVYNLMTGPKNQILWDNCKVSGLLG